MIRLQDIADMAGVSRTTVSNVINGNTKRVSQKTIDKITAILKEQNYVPHMGSVMLSGHGSRIIGVVLGFAQAHGMYSLQDSFVGELVGTIQMEAEMKGYYIMLIGGENIQNVVDIASRWNVEGLIILGYNDEKYRKLSRKLNKKMVLIDAYPAGEYFFQNVIDFFFFLMRQYRIFQTDTQCFFLHHIYFCLTQQVILQQTVSMKFCQNTAPVHIQQIFQCILFRQLKMFNDLDIHRMMWKQLSFQFTFQKIYFFFWQKSAASKVDTQRVSLSRCGNF